MSDLRIRLFGGLEILRGGEALPPFPTRRARSLMAYLVLNRDRSLSRDALCGLLWGEQPEAEARKALRSALWRIRSVLEPEEADRGRYLKVDAWRVSFPGTGRAWVDAAEFEACLEGLRRPGPDAMAEEDARRLDRAVRLYQGDLLEGLYERWCCQDRERFELAYLTALERLLAYHQARGSWLSAISFAHQILRKDPLREHVHRRLMVCHLSMGDRPSALRQYQTCLRLTREELGVDPMEETQRMHAWIRDRGALPPEGAGAEILLPAGDLRLKRKVEGALQELHGLVARLEAARAAETDAGSSGGSE